MTPQQQAAWKAMAEALKPFVDLLGSFEPYADDVPISLVYEPHIVWLEGAITIGTIRKARKALALAQANKPREVDGDNMKEKP